MVQVLKEMSLLTISQKALGQAMWFGWSVYSSCFGICAQSTCHDTPFSWYSSAAQSAAAVPSQSCLPPEPGSYSRLHRRRVSRVLAETAMADFSLWQPHTSLRPRHKQVARLGGALLKQDPLSLYLQRKKSVKNTHDIDKGECNVFVIWIKILKISSPNLFSTYKIR